MLSHNIIYQQFLCLTNNSLIHCLSNHLNMLNGWNKDAYRREQEAFVSGHNGTTAREVIHVLLPNICSVLLTITTVALLRRLNILHEYVKVVLEFILIVIPSILCCTIWSEYVLTITCAMMTISVVNIVLLRITSNNVSTRFPSERRPFITNFRALTNMISAICILAVDFKIFPRKFAKTETFGYSLMDTGVGLFVFANALVAPEARDFAPRPGKNFFFTISKNIKYSARKCIPLLILGFGRSCAIEVLGYQKHVTAYGVHWNFFITLAAVKLFTSSITSTINSKYSLLSGIWILGMHEYVLSTKGLKEWILSDRPRNNFVSANREGVYSVPGYVGLYLVGVAIGRLIHSTYKNSHALRNKYKTLCIKLFGYELDASYNESMILCVKLSLISAQTCAAMLFCNSYFGVSRRLANAGYCMWMLTLGTVGLTLLLLLEIIINIVLHAPTDSEPVEKKTMDKLNAKNGGDNVPKKCEKTYENNIEIFEAINYNGLLYFLVSNAETGVINMLTNTLQRSKAEALQILISYMGTSMIMILLMYKMKLQVRL